MTPPPSGTRGRAIVANRADAGPVDTTEIRQLTEAAGFAVVDTITQVRTEDPGTYFGSGKLATLAERAHDHDVDLVAIDGDVDPGQYRTIAGDLPPDTMLYDRLRLVLDIFAEGATDRRAKRQIELATLRYELERYEATADESPLTQMSEKGSPRYDLEDRIAAIERELEELPDPGERLQERRSRDDLDLVVLAGYTNAGKSTLLHRLADDLDVEQLADVPDDIDPVAAVEDRLFKTLETTTRRATLRRRPTLCVDTVGYLDALPHDLVKGFSETLSAAAVADTVVLVTDASLPAPSFERYVRVAMDVLDAQDVAPSAVVTAVNKIDRVDPDSLTDRLETAAALATEPVPISATEGANVDVLIDAIVERLPTAERTLSLPHGDHAMRLLSAAYDAVAVDDVTYGEDAVRVRIRGRPAAVERLAARAPTS